LKIPNLKLLRMYSEKVMASLDFVYIHPFILYHSTVSFIPTGRVMAG
jgi:hypothetical protein